MLTWVRVTKVNFFVTSFTHETWRAFAGEVVDEVSTIGAKNTRFFSTVVDVDFTVGPGPSGRTVALVSSLKKWCTSTTVQAYVNTS